MGVADAMGGAMRRYSNLQGAPMQEDWQWHNASSIQLLLVLIAEVHGATTCIGCACLRHAMRSQHQHCDGKH